MKIEEISEKNSLKSNDKCNYWFPLRKGYNRLSIILSILVALIIAFIQRRADDGLLALVATMLVEIGLYLSAIWIYRGFKDQ